MLESGCEIRTTKELLRHRNVETTMINTHLIKHGGKGVKSPADLYFMLLKRATYAKKFKRGVI